MTKSFDKNISKWDIQFSGKPEEFSIYSGFEFKSNHKPKWK